MCWSDRANFSGVRFVAELDASFLFQFGDNRFEGAGFSLLPKFAVEFNILKGWISAQFALFGPSTVRMDTQSPVTSKLRSDVERVTVAGETVSRTVVDNTVSVNLGLSAGLSVLDGSLALGVGRLFYDRRDFDVPECTEGQLQAIRDARLALDTEPGTDAARIDELRMAYRGLEGDCFTSSDLSDTFVFFSFQTVTSLENSLKGSGSTESDGGGF